MSDTPRTDAVVTLTFAAGHNTICPNFARQLERELAAAQARIAESEARAVAVMHEHHLRDEAMIVQRTEEIRALEATIASERTNRADFAKDACAVLLERDQLKSDYIKLMQSCYRGDSKDVAASERAQMKYIADELRHERDQLRAELEVANHSIVSSLVYNTLKEDNDQLRAEVERLTNQRDNLLKPLREQAEARAESAEQQLHALRLVCGTTDADKFSTWVTHAMARAERAEAEVTELKKKQPINTHVRLFDLVRYMRAELQEQDLITSEEYSWLCYESPMANSPKGGSPSPRRLEDYDELRAELAAERARLDWLEKYLSDDSKNLSQPHGEDRSWWLGYNTGPAYQIDGAGDTLRAAIDTAMKEGAK
jgi:hypothetical protein